MTEFTPTVTIELEDYMYLKKAYEEYGERMEEIEMYIQGHNKDIWEDMRDDGLFSII